MSDAVIVAIAAAIPGILGAYAAILGAKRTKAAHDEVRTNHGLRAGEYLEMVSSNVNDLRVQLAEHTEQDTANFQELRALMQPE